MLRLPHDIEVGIINSCINENIKKITLYGARVLSQQLTLRHFDARNDELVDCGQCGVISRCKETFGGHLKSFHFALSTLHFILS